jgi:hypothetical protein
MKSIIKKLKTGRWIKWSIIYCSLLIALLCFPSCEDFLTKTPPHQISDAGYWKDEMEVQVWISGIYNGVNTALQDRLIWWGEGRSDSSWPGMGAGLFYSLDDIQSDDNLTNWNSLYVVINRCNIAIQHLPGAPLSETARNSYLGQCYGVRALMYFWLIRVWGDVPLILETWNGNAATKYNSRTPVAQILPIIENDINEAIRLTDNASVWYLGTGAALAMKIDFLAWCKRYTEIPGVFQQLTDLRRYSLISTVNDWNKTFSNPAASSESIFSLYYSITQSDNVRSPYASTIGFPYPSGWTLYNSSKKMYELMTQDTLDIRFWGVVQRSDYTAELTPENAPEFTWPNVTGGTNWCPYVFKYAPLGASKGTFVTGNEWPYKPPVYRYADVLLLYAEALNRIGNMEGALSIINQLHISRGSNIVVNSGDYSEPFGNTKRSVEKLIYDERQLELYGEGKRWFDLMRADWGMEVIDEHIKYLKARVGIENLKGFTDRGRLYWPVNKSVLDSNPNLVQSASYQ